MIGCLRFYDAASRWGVIVADEGGLYMLQAALPSGPPLREGERLRFDATPGPGGLRATAVQRLSPTAAPRPTPFTKGPTHGERKHG